MPPPANPVAPGDATGFEHIEAAIGTRLPQDYKRLIHAYGAGSWLDFYWVINPFVKHYADIWLDPNHWLMEFLRKEHEQWPEVAPYPIWPEPGGLLPWGGNENGGYLFWLTEGEADAWPTIHMADRTPEYDRFDKPCTQLLVETITGENKILTAAFRHGLSHLPRFVPARD